MIEEKPASQPAEPIVPKEEDQVVEVIDVEEAEMEVVVETAPIETKVEEKPVETKVEEKPVSQSMDDEILK